MTVALCTAVTLRRPCARAYSKARLATRAEAGPDRGFSEMPACGDSSTPRVSRTSRRSSAAASSSWRYSIPAYRSSRFMRTTTTSVPGNGVRTPA